MTKAVLRPKKTALTNTGTRKIMPTLPSAWAEKALMTHATPPVQATASVLRR